MSFPLAVVIVIAIAVAIWVQHRKEVQQNGNDNIIVTPKKPDTTPAPSPGTPTTVGDNAALGMPSNASTSTPDDYLISKPKYVLSYNRSHGIPNWVAWHLSTADLGPTDRSQFTPDSTLPKGWTRITPNDYRNIGYDRGHMCPSADRTATKADNAQTFLMTNIVPQAADNNQGPWADLEDYCRTLARAGNELYIVAGVGGPFAPIADGKLVVPTSTWKVILVMPEGADDVTRIDARTRVISVLLPNENGIRDRDWKSFRTSVDAIQKATGYTFFANVPDAVRSKLATHVDTE